VNNWDSIDRLARNRPNNVAEQRLLSRNDRVVGMLLREIVNSVLIGVGVDSLIYCCHRDGHDFYQQKSISASSYIVDIRTHCGKKMCVHNDLPPLLRTTINSISPAEQYHRNPPLILTIKRLSLTYYST
jgi:hypothetical protein